MDQEILYKQIIEEWELENVPEDDRTEILEEIAKTIHTQFLLDAYNVCGEENFKALEASVNMGNEFYETTLKHTIPNYEEIFQRAKEKVYISFKKQAHLS